MNLNSSMDIGGDIVGDIVGDIAGDIGGLLSSAMRPLLLVVCGPEKKGDYTSPPPGFLFEVQK
ncbi:MAG: hypothetical protein BZY83_01940 [SAR202 cluster bacterium Casp-Chloro-G2]|nr:MAG: hypothetical protein BZY83_01940 [SAR202 cluster bacterium Casp-Chloro-G2]